MVQNIIGIKEKIKGFIANHRTYVITVSTIFVLSMMFIAVFISLSQRPKKDSYGENESPKISQTENTQKNQQQDKSSVMENKALASFPACPKGKELFTTFPVKEGDYTSIIPLGNLNPSGHTFPTDHIYVEVFDPQNPGAMKTVGRKSLIAPADMWVFGIHISEEVGGITDYAIDFSPCRDVKGKFGHVGTISTKIKTEMEKETGRCNEYETGGKKYRNCDYDNMKIQVKAGEEIGTAGSERSGMLDIWMSDYREPQVKRSNVSRWSSDWNYVSCFLDYYKSSQKDHFYNLLKGPNNGRRTKEPRCGTVEVDIAGTAQGVWFYNLQGMIRQEDPHLALVFDNIQTDKQVFSVGTSANSAGIPSNVYRFAPVDNGKINRDFSQITSDGAVYCYNTKNYRGENKIILMTMPSPEKLRIKILSTSCGSGPWEMTSGFVEYER